MCILEGLDNEYDSQAKELPKIKNACDELYANASNIIEEKNNEIKSLKKHNKFLSDIILNQMLVTKLSIK